MKWTCEEILDHAEELADRFEAFDPAKAQEVPAAEYLPVRAARGRTAATSTSFRLSEQRVSRGPLGSASVQSSASRASRRSASAPLRSMRPRS